METILSNKSKSYERITLDMLLKFIKINLSTFQPCAEIIVEKEEKTKQVEKNISAKTQSTKKSFYEELDYSTKPINFESSFIKNFPNFPQSNLLVCNLLSLFVPTESETKNKKIDYSKYTFFKAILYNSISNMTETDLENILKTLVKHVSYGGITEFNYSKLKWTKKTLKDNLNQNIINEMTIRVTSDYFHVNIFVINEDSKKIEYGGGDFIPFKKNIFVYKYKDSFYPVFTQNNKFFPFNSDLMVYLLKNTNNITLLSHDQFTFKEEDLSKYINLSKILPEIEVSDNNSLSQNLSHNLSHNLSQTNKTEHSVINKFDDDYSESSEDEDSKTEENEQDGKFKEQDSKFKEQDGKFKEHEQEIYDKLSKYSLMELQKEAKKYNIETKMNGKLKSKKDLCMEICKLKKSS
jgi:hypothetical protein